MNTLKNFHPAVTAVYFVTVLGFEMFLMHPACLAAGLLSGLLCLAGLKGWRRAAVSLLYMIPLMLGTAALNPALNHQGTTILGYLPSGNPLTLESIFYGAAAAVMLANVLCWFSCHNEVMTSDKLICLFGKIVPALSLVLSMTLRFVPRFTAQLKAVAEARRCMGHEPGRGGILRRAGEGLAILSVMVSWALENSVETADSMKARGYGLPGRTAFSVFTFRRRDGAALLSILFLGGYVLTGVLHGGLFFRYFPSMKGAEINIYAISVFAAYLGLCLMPVMLELWEVVKWKAIKSKI